MGDLFDLAAARALRDEGINRAKASNQKWFNDGLALLMDPAFQSLFTDFTGEDLRQEIQVMVGIPLHPNAMGSLIMAAVKKEIIAKTGEYRPMKLKASHGRATPVYKWSRNR